MRYLSFLIPVLLAASMACANDCTVVGPSKVRCRSKSSAAVKLFTKMPGNLWKLKKYYPEERGEQTEGVYSSYVKMDMDMFSKACILEMREDDEANIDSLRTLCSNIIDLMLFAIDKGSKVSLPGDFQFHFDIDEEVSVMYCMSSTYVRTYKYNKVTQLQTDRRDYQDLKAGTYCTDFLATDDMYWFPKKK